MLDMDFFIVRHVHRQRARQVQQHGGQAVALIALPQTKSPEALVGHVCVAADVNVSYVLISNRFSYRYSPPHRSVCLPWLQVMAPLKLCSGLARCCGPTLPIPLLAEPI